MLNTIKLNKNRLEDFAYEFSSSDLFEDGEGINEEFLLLYTKASELAYEKYKKEYNEEPEFPYDPDFSGLIAKYFTPILFEKYKEFYIEEEHDEDDIEMVNSASFYAIQNGEKIILIEDINGKMVYGW